VEVPQDELMPAAVPTFFRNVTISGSPTPVRAYMDPVLPDVLESRIETRRFFDWVGSL